jgi:hypothetical protein
MKKMKKQGPTENTEYTEGHRTLCVMISGYFSVSLVLVAELLRRVTLVLRSGATPQRNILCILWALIKRRKIRK